MPGIRFVEVQVSHLPKCDICGETAHFDAKSKDGRWGYFCHMHFNTHTWGKLGVGFGQKLVLKQDETTK